ncbi:MAG: hypothetical protein L0154_05570 [Chloroflexi bacterium]|nr:hypothetical protein [Chloroflexota bacterium]
MKAPDSNCRGFFVSQYQRVRVGWLAASGLGGRALQSLLTTAALNLRRGTGLASTESMIMPAINDRDFLENNKWLRYSLSNQTESGNAEDVVNQDSYQVSYLL